MRRLQLASLTEDRTWLGHVAEREILFDRQRVHVAFQAAVRQQRLQFGAEDETAVGQPRVVQRLHGQAVAGQKQRLAVAVPQHEREHAAQALDAVRPPGLPGMHDDLGVAAGVEHMAEGQQFGDQLGVVVDLPVEDDDHRTVFVEERLLAGGHVDDRQPPVAESDTRLDVHVAFIGPAVMLRLVHAEQHRTVDVSFAAGVEDASDSAHVDQ